MAPPEYCPIIQWIISNSSNQTNQLNSLRLFTISLHGMFSIIGVLENLLILGVVGFQMRLSVISIWILNLAASDLLATASLSFFTLYLAQGESWTLGKTFCQINSSIFFLNMFVSAFLLMAISLDRCLVVLRPVWAQNHRNTRLTGSVCGLIWMVATLFTIPFYIFRDTILLPNGRLLCYYNYALFVPAEPYDLRSLCKQREVALTLIKFFVAFLIPLVVIILSYSSVNAQLARRGCRRPFRFVRLVAAVVVSFGLCWAPYHFFCMIEVFVSEQNPFQVTIRKALPFVATIGFLNSVLNPVLYVFSCPDLCNKIRHSVGAVMESVLAEDLADLARRRSTAQSTNSMSTVLKKQKPSVPLSGPQD